MAIFNGTAGNDVADVGNVEFPLVGFTGGTEDELKDNIGDTFNCFGSNDVVVAGGGNDTLLGGDGNDALTGGDGNDLLEGGLGNDIVSGGSGTDTASYANAETAVTVNLFFTGNQVIAGAEFERLSGIENLFGSSFDDVLTGDANNNYLYGFLGDDNLVGSAGDDLLEGVIGNDNLVGGAGNDTLVGGDDIDVLRGGNGNDILAGGNGEDQANYDEASSGVTVNLAITTAQNTIGAGTDTLTEIEDLWGSSFSDTLTGDANVNQLIGDNGNDVLNGGDNQDFLFGNNGDDVLNGQAGDDQLEGGTGNDVLSGGSNTFGDGAHYGLANSGVTVNLSISTAQNTVGDGVDTLIGIENLFGSSFNDTFVGDANSNLLSGGDGNDVLVGGAGNDTLGGHNGDDVLRGDAGNDLISGGAGIDTASYAGSIAGVTVNLALPVQNTGGAGTDQLTLIEALIGSSFNDILTGDGSGNSLSGGDGNDILRGAAGNDIISGGNGIDTASYVGASGGVTVNLTLTAAQNTVGAGIDTLSGIENLIGSSFNDTLSGSGGANILDGGLGLDALVGGLGNDTFVLANGTDTVSDTGGIDTITSTITRSLGSYPAIENLTLLGAAAINGTGNSLNNTIIGNGATNVLNGGVGNDTLNSGFGNDTLIGGVGKDTMTGSGNADRFDFNALAESVVGANRDLIQDFNRVQGDKIDLSTIDADTDGTAGNQAFSFIGAGAFTGVDGQLRCAAGIIQGDVNGDKVADFEIKVNLATMISSDFIV